MSALAIAFNPTFWKYVQQYLPSDTLHSHRKHRSINLHPPSLTFPPALSLAEVPLSRHKSAPQKPCSQKPRIPPQNAHAPLQWQLALRLLRSRPDHLLPRSRPRCPVRLPLPPHPHLPTNHPTQLRARPAPPTPLPPLHPPLPRLPPPHPRQHPSANILLRARHNRHLPRRLLRHPDGRARHRLPLQYHQRAYVFGVYDELFGHGVAVWTARGGVVDGGCGGGLLGGVEVGGSFYGGDL